MDPSPASPRVALGSAPLPRHRSTFGASSEDLARPQGEGVVTTERKNIHWYGRSVLRQKDNKITPSGRCTQRPYYR